MRYTCNHQNGKGKTVGINSCTSVMMCGFLLAKEWMK